MHFSGGGGHGGGLGHGGGGHHGGHSGHAGGGHHGGQGGLSIGHILGLNHSHGGGGLFGHLAHMLGGHHGAVHHHHHHGAGGGEPDQSPSWNMAMQAEKNGTGGFLRKFNLRFTPAVGFFFLFIFLTFWLGVIYQLRHHEPTENFSALSKQLYGQQLPTTRLYGQTLPTVGVNDPANARPNTFGGQMSGEASTPMPQGFAGAASATVPQSFSGSAAASAPQSYAPAAPVVRPQYHASGYGAAQEYGQFGTPIGQTYGVPASATPAYAVYGGQSGMYAPAPTFGTAASRSAYASSNGTQRWRVVVSH